MLIGLYDKKIQLHQATWVVFGNDKFDLQDLTPFFNKQSIFDPHPENCLSSSKKPPQKIV